MNYSIEKKGCMFMKIEGMTHGQTLEIKLDGRLDTTSAPELEQYLCDNLSEVITTVIFDFEKLLYISSAGLRLLLTAQKKVNAVSGTVTLKNVNKLVRDILDSVGFSDILTIE